MFRHVSCYRVDLCLETQTHGEFREKPRFYNQLKSQTGASLVHRSFQEVHNYLFPHSCAETDSYAPLEMIDALGKHLSETSVDYKIEVFPETHHGFAFPNRGQLYNRIHAETHWFRILDLFSRKLK